MLSVRRFAQTTAKSHVTPPDITQSTTVTTRTATATRRPTTTNPAKRATQILLAVALGAGGLLAGAQTANAATGDVTTFSGSTVGFAEGIGTAARFNRPFRIAVDNAGTIYVADFLNNRIRKINPATGQSSTLAGNGGGDNINGATGATSEISQPVGIAVDSAGNVYVAQNNSNLIRKINGATGATTTLAGDGTAGYADGLTGALSQFSNPQDVAVDVAGNVYVADAGNNRIRKIDQTTGIVSTLAGNGTASSTNGATGALSSFTNPYGLALDASGNLYVGEFSGRRVRKVNTTTGATSTLAATLAGTEAFNSVYDVAVDGAGNIIVPDPFNYRVRKINAVTEAVTTVAGTGVQGSLDGTSTTAQFDSPTGAAVDAAQNIYIVESNIQRIRKIEGNTPVVPPTSTTTTTTVAPTTTTTTTTTTTAAPVLVFLPVPPTSAPTTTPPTTTQAPVPVTAPPAALTTTAPTTVAPTTTTAPATTVAPTTPTTTPPTTVAPTPPPAVASEAKPGQQFTVNFTARSSTLSKTAKATVGSAAQKLGAVPTGTRISVFAHAPKTSTAKDRALAAKRANAVAKALKTALGKTRAAGLRFTVVTQSSSAPAQTNQVTIQFAG
jgi:sugar lactone lactonase YvrE/outer membrane protein OmpA-like peptidoglycan-associated protein